MTAPGRTRPPVSGPEPGAAPAARAPGPRTARRARAAAALPPLARAQRRRQLAGLITLALLQGLLVVAVALWARALLEQVPPVAQLPPGLALALLAALLGGAAALRGWQTQVAERLAQGYVARVRLALFDALVSLSPEARQRRSRGGTLLRFVGDAAALRQWVGDGLPTLVAAALAWPVLLGALAVLDLRWAALALGWGLVALAGMALTLPRLKAAVRAARWRQAVMAARVHDQLAVLDAVQAAAREQAERKALSRRQRHLARAAERRAQALALHRLWVDGSLAGLALSVLALWLHDAGARAVFAAGSGTLLGALGLIAFMAAPLRQSGRALAQWTSAQVARERIAEFLADAERRPRGRAPEPAADAELQLSGPLVPGGPVWRASLAPGRRVAVTGASGSGKTALIEALAGIRQTPGLSLRWGGVPVARLDAAVRARCIGLVTAGQRPPRGRVDAVLCERHPKAGAAAQWEACVLAGWPHGSPASLTRPVRDGGANLGDSERRSLLLARALLGTPRLLLVDELEHCLVGPVRPAAERLLRRYRGAVVFTTQDPALAALADEVWDLDRGLVRQRTAPGAPPLRQVA